MDIYATTAVWRRDRAISLVIAASQLIEEEMTDKQKGMVRQILFDALRIFFQAQKELRPGCLSAAFFPFRTWTHRQGMLDYTEPALGLAERILIAPQDAVQILDQYDRLFPDWYKAINNHFDNDDEDDEDIGLPEEHGEHGDL